MNTVDTHTSSTLPSYSREELLKLFDEASPVLPGLRDTHSRFPELETILSERTLLPQLVKDSLPSNTRLQYNSRPHPPQPTAPIRTDEEYAEFEKRLLAEASADDLWDAPRTDSDGDALNYFTDENFKKHQAQIEEERQKFRAETQTETKKAAGVSSSEIQQEPSPKAEDKQLGAAPTDTAGGVSSYSKQTDFSVPQTQIGTDNQHYRSDFTETQKPLSEQQTPELKSQTYSSPSNFQSSNPQTATPDMLQGACWHYIDNSQKEQGPFTQKDMESWYERKLLPPQLYIRLSCERVFTTIPNHWSSDASKPFESAPLLLAVRMDRGTVLAPPFHEAGYITFAGELDNPQKPEETVPVVHLPVESLNPRLTVAPVTREQAIQFTAQRAEEQRRKQQLAALSQRLDQQDRAQIPHLIGHFIVQLLKPKYPTHDQNALIQEFEKLPDNEKQTVNEIATINVMEYLIQQKQRYQQQMQQQLQQQQQRAQQEQSIWGLQQQAQPIRKDILDWVHQSVATLIGKQDDALVRELFAATSLAQVREAISARKPQDQAQVEQFISYFVKVHPVS